MLKAAELYYPRLSGFFGLLSTFLSCLFSLFDFDTDFDAVSGFLPPLRGYLSNLTSEDSELRSGWGEKQMYESCSVMEID